MQALCLGCKQPVEVRIAGKSRIVNMPTVSIIVVEHSEQSFCENRGVPVVAQVSAVAGLAMVAAPVPPSEQNIIVVPL